jgi:hypothetical protein
MGFIKTGDVFVPEMLEDILPGAFAGMIALFGTGAAIIKTTMPFSKSALGTTVKVPYFDTIGEAQDLVNDGDALTPQGLSSDLEQAIVAHSGIAIEATKFAEWSGVADPYVEGARQMAIAVKRRADLALITAAQAPASELLVNDVYSAGSPVTLNYDVVVDSKSKWGDEQDDIVMMVVHSKVKNDLLKLKDAIGRPLLHQPGDGKLDMLSGIPVMVSDRLGADNETPGKYTSLILKKGALIFWMNGQARVLTDSDILTDSDVAAMHFYWACHRYKRMPGFTKCGVVAMRHN